MHWNVFAHIRNSLWHIILSLSDQAISRTTNRTVLIASVSECRSFTSITHHVSWRTHVCIYCLSLFDQLTASILLTLPAGLFANVKCSIYTSMIVVVRDADEQPPFCWHCCTYVWHVCCLVCSVNMNQQGYFTFGIQPIELYWYHLDTYWSVTATHTKLFAAYSLNVCSSYQPYNQ